MKVVESEPGLLVNVGAAMIGLIEGQPGPAETRIRHLSEQEPAGRVESMVNNIGYSFLQSEKAEVALKVFELNTKVFPSAFNTWDSLGEAHMKSGNSEEAVRCYERSYQLNKENSNAKEMIARIKAKE